MHAHASDPSAPARQAPVPAAAGPLDAMLAALEAGGWSRKVLERALPPLLAHAGTLGAGQRTEWLAALLRAWRRHGAALRRPALRTLLALAAAWDAWPLAYRVGMALAAGGALDGDDACHLLAACMHACDTQGALELSVRRQLLHPHEPAFAAHHDHLLAWLHWRGQRPRPGLADPELSLEPLAHHHVAPFGWQYHDPSIGSLCCLPCFGDGAEWHGWLDDAYSAPGQYPFAVLHRDWGFVGCVSLAMHGDIGCFYYWLGCDFQGCGFGPRAVRLLLGLGVELGMRCCYAKVFVDNAPSRRALAKLGFADLGMRGAAPHELETFYRWGEPCPRAGAAAELHWLLDHMGSDTRPAFPLLYPATWGPT